MLTVIKENRYELALLSFSLLWVLGSFVASLIFPKGNWFSRSGAIMVLLSVIVEFHIGISQQKQNSRASVVAGLGVPSSSNLPKFKQNIAWTAHIFVISGTLIWGYGDFLV